MLISDEEAKAVQEVAKATQQALPIANGFGRFVARVIGGPLEQGVGIVEDRLKYMRWERQVRLMQRSSELLDELGISDNVRPVPLNVAVPLLQAATLEENDELQDRWAKLLVNAMDPKSRVEIRRFFVSVLEDFGPLEAVLLERIVSAPADAGSGVHVKTAALPDAYLAESDSKVCGQPSQDVAVALWNLVRLGCVSPIMTHGGLSIAQVQLTPLGQSLVMACSLRNRA